MARLARLLGLVWLLASTVPTVAVAQVQSPDAPAPKARPAAKPKPAPAPASNGQDIGSTPEPAASEVAPVRRGDTWSYEHVDEITGDLKWTLTFVVTDVTAKEIVTRFSRRGQEGAPGMSIFDHRWNAVEDGAWKRKPRDSTGINGPLAVGAEWRASWSSENLKSGQVFRSNAKSKVVAEEEVTTPAGKFPAFKIVTEILDTNTNDPTFRAKVVVTTWYSKAVNRWVKRTHEVHVGGRLRDHFSHNLSDHSRRP